MMPSWNPKNEEDAKSQLSIWLSILFESSPILLDKLVPQLIAHLANPATPPPSSYQQILNDALAIIDDWAPLDRAKFIAGHPRIGEVNNLSKLSAKEQATVATPAHILARLEHLNACYEHAYPGLRYIIFVDGRTRAAIVPLLEEAIGLEPASLTAEDDPAQPPVSSVQQYEVEGEAWTRELNRAITDVGLIAQARLSAM